MFMKKNVFVKSVALIIMIVMIAAVALTACADKEAQKANEELSAQLEQLKADLAAVKEQADKVPGLQTELDNTKTELDGTKTELDNTKTELDNTKTELDNTKTELDNTKTELDNTKGELNDAKDTIEDLKNNPPKTPDLGTNPDDGFHDNENWTNAEVYITAALKELYAQRANFLLTENAWFLGSSAEELIKYIETGYYIGTNDWGETDIIPVAELFDNIEYCKDVLLTEEAKIYDAAYQAIKRGESKEAVDKALASYAEETAKIEKVEVTYDKEVQILKNWIEEFCKIDGMKSTQDEVNAVKAAFYGILTSVEHIEKMDARLQMLFWGDAYDAIVDEYNKVMDAFCNHKYDKVDGAFDPMAPLFEKGIQVLQADMRLQMAELTKNRYNLVSRYTDSVLQSKYVADYVTFVEDYCTSDDYANYEKFAGNTLGALLFHCATENENKGLESFEAVFFQYTIEVLNRKETIESALTDAALAEIYAAYNTAYNNGDYRLTRATKTQIDALIKAVAEWAEKYDICIDPTDDNYVYDNFGYVMTTVWGGEIFWSFETIYEFEAEYNAQLKAIVDTFDDFVKAIHDYTEKLIDANGVRVYKDKDIDLGIVSAGYVQYDDEAILDNLRALWEAAETASGLDYVLNKAYLDQIFDYHSDYSMAGKLSNWYDLLVQYERDYYDLTELIIDLNNAVDNLYNKTNFKGYANTQMGKTDMFLDRVWYINLVPFKVASAKPTMYLSEWSFDHYTNVGSFTNDPETYLTATRTDAMEAAYNTMITEIDNNLAGLQDQANNILNNWKQPVDAIADSVAKIKTWAKIIKDEAYIVAFEAALDAAVATYGNDVIKNAVGELDRLMAYLAISKYDEAQALIDYLPVQLPGSAINPVA